MRTRQIGGILLGMICVAGLIVGCSDSVSEPETGTGTMQVLLIDSPGDYDAVNVEVIEVRVHRAGADSLTGWHTIAVDTTFVNLLDLTNGNYAVLADSTLPAGDYTQVRLILGDNNTVVVDGETFALEIPSSSQTGLKLNHPFAIEDGAIYSVTLDFDADRSVHRTGNGQYKMKPVIHLVVNAMSGSISGTVEPVDARAMVLALANDDTVYAYADTLNGDFDFPMLMQGTWDLKFSATAGSYRDSTIAGVMVTAGQDNHLGTVTLASE